jgi:hypothetical protein
MRSNLVQVIVFTGFFVVIGFGYFLYEKANQTPASTLNSETLTRTNELAESSKNSNSDAILQTNTVAEPVSAADESVKFDEAVDGGLREIEQKVQKQIQDDLVTYSSECSSGQDEKCILLSRHISNLQACLDSQTTAVQLEACVSTEMEKFVSNAFTVYQSDLDEEQKQFIAELDTQQRGHITATNPTQETLSTLREGETKKEFSWTEVNEQGIAVTYSSVVTYARTSNTVLMTDIITSKYGTNTTKRTFTIK